MAIKNSEIAERLRGIRLLSDVSVYDMAKAMKISAEEYRHLEDGSKMIPVSVLIEACTILNISMTELLTGEKAKLKTYSLVKKGRGVSVERNNAYKYENLAFNFSQRKVEPLMVYIEPNDNPEIPLNAHMGQEYHYCIEGSYICKIGNKELIIEEGDSLYFDSVNPHGMKALNDKTAKILVITI